MNKRLVGALSAYAVLIAIALFVLSGKILLAVVGLFFALAIKTVIAAKAGW